MSFDPSVAFGYSAAPAAQPAVIGGVAGAVPAQDGFYTYEWNPTPAAGPVFPPMTTGPVIEETTVVQQAPFYGAAPIAAPVAPAPYYETGYYDNGCCQSCGTGCNNGCIGGCGCNGCNGCYQCGGCGGCGAGYCGGGCAGCCTPALPGPCHWVISIIFCFFALVAFVFFIVGCATSQWTKDYRVRGSILATPAAGTVVNLGLWRFCTGSESGCADINDLNNPLDVPQSGSFWDRWNTVRAFSIIALVVTFFAWVLSIWFIFRYNYAIKWTIITLATLGWISGLIAMAVWVSIHNDLVGGDYGYFRPSDLVKTLLPQLDPLTEQQLVGICNLQQSSQQAEEALSQGLDQLHQSLADTMAGGSLIDDTNMSFMGQMALALGKLSNLEGFVIQADNLRQQTLHQMHRILTVRQAARCFLAIGEYHNRLRALSSLWVSRPREILGADEGNCGEISIAAQASQSQFSSF